MKYQSDIESDPEAAPALEKLEVVRLADVGALAYVAVSNVLTDFETDIRKHEEWPLTYLESLVPALQEFRAAADKFVKAIEPEWYEEETRRMAELANYEDPDVPFTD